MESSVTGDEIQEIANLTPPSHYMILGSRLSIPHEQLKEILESTSHDYPESIIAILTGWRDQHQKYPSMRRRLWEMLSEVGLDKAAGVLSRDSDSDFDIDSLPVDPLDHLDHLAPPRAVAPRAVARAVEVARRRFEDSDFDIDSLPVVDPPLALARGIVKRGEMSKRLGKDGGELHLPELGVHVYIPAGALAETQDITMQILSQPPKELPLAEDEVIVSAGIRCQQVQHLGKAVRIVLPHCASFLDAARVKSVFYHSYLHKGSPTFERIPSKSEGMPRCDVRKHELELWINEFSDWYIVILIEKYFLGKTVKCTPYLPRVLPEHGEPILCFFFVHDDTDEQAERVEKEAEKQNYKRALPPTLFFVAAKPIDMKLTFSEDNAPQDQKKVIFRRDLFHLRENLVIFRLRPVDISSEHPSKTLKITVNQETTKTIEFLRKFERTSAELDHWIREMRRNEPPRRDRHGHTSQVSGSGMSAPADSRHAQDVKEARGKEEICARKLQSSTTTMKPLPIMGACAGADKDLLYQGLSGGATSKGLVDAVKVESLPISMSPPQIMGAYAGAGDNMTTPITVIQTQFANINISSGGKGSDSCILPHERVVPYMLRQEICSELKMKRDLGDDWKRLACELGMDKYIDSLTTVDNPPETLIEKAESEGKIKSLGDLTRAFSAMERQDLMGLIDRYVEGAVAKQDHSDPGDASDSPSHGSDGDVEWSDA